MGIFGSRKQPKQQPPLLTATPDDLRRIGITAFGGESVHPAGINALSAGELDSYAIAYLEAVGYPPSGSPEEIAAASGFFDELTGKALAAGDWGYVGAILVLGNTIASSYRQDPRYLAIIDRGLETLRRDGVAYTALPPYTVDLWTSLHGYDGIHPKGWPSPLENLPSPSADAAARLVDISVGESRPLAQAPAAPQNVIHGERRAADRIQAVLEGVDPDTGLTRRWDWDGVTAPDYQGFLALLGEKVVTHTFWAHEDLVPYIPCRARTREEMRAEAAKISASH